MTVVVTHTTPADSTFSSTGAAAWNANHALSGVGTMAEQDANSVAITGGTINGTTLGATTPATGVFTTLTAQTEVLKGTGQNLVFQSQAYNNAYWSANSSVTRADNQTTAPDGSSTAGTITSINAVYGGLLRQTPVVTSTTYTLSAYVKKNNWSYVGLRLGSLSGAGDRYAYFNFDTLATSTNGISGATFTATSVGSGWYRIVLSGVVTASAGAACDVAIVASDGASATNNGAGQIVYVWGVQLELGATANTYIPTTTTQIYGTPTLSFSGVSTIGLESNGSLFVQPAGTGALQAQATTSSAVGGNARGANAVDWQTKRNAATQVASGLGSVICGGEERNTASGQQSFVGTGYNNSSSTYGATIVSGVNNSNAGLAAFIGAGSSHTIGSNGAYSVLVGGNTNTSSGRYNFIGGGTLNSGTSGSAVTSQATTAVTSGSTAVTLSASNGSIKVGQLINGTGMSENTYVAAISGTSLTLSQNATATGTPTLTFLTPHGVVVGGGNNQATGSYSFIGGGGDAGTAANRNVASGDWSFVGGGIKNTASGVYSFVGGGAANIAAGTGSTIAGGGAYGASIALTSQNNITSNGTSSFVGAGIGNTISNAYSVIGAGANNTVNGQFSGILSGGFGSTRGITGYHAFPACYSPISGTTGVSQAAIIVLGRETTNATSAVLTSDSTTTGNTVNQVILPNNSAYYFKGSVIANVTGAANGAAWSFEGAIMRGANAGTTVLIGTPAINRVASTSGASAWTIALTADTSNGGLAVTVTGAASTTIRWVASLNTVEVTF
jgi:hypothetical protein